MKTIYQIKTTSSRILKKIIDKISAEKVPSLRQQISDK